MNAAPAANLVEVRDLSLAYQHEDGWLQVLFGVDFSIAPGEVLGLVGESGCGKSTVAYQLLGYRPPSARVLSGEVRFRGVDLLKLSRIELDRTARQPRRADPAESRIGAEPRDARRPPGGRGGDHASSTCRRRSGS